MAENEQQTPDFLREDEERRERWAHLTEGLENDYVQRAIVETMLDNTRRMIEGTLPQVRMEAGTSTADLVAFNRVAYPLIRRLYPSLVANRLVSIQPTKLPVTLVHFLDIVRKTNQSPTVSGDRIDYSAGRGNPLYAAGVVRDEALGTSTADQTAFTLDHYPVVPGSETIFVNSAPVTNYDIDYATGAVVFQTGLAVGKVVTADYSIVQEGTDKIPELGLTMSSAQLGTEERRLKGVWTLEGAQDFSAYHNLSLDREMLRALSQEMGSSIDRSVIGDLYAAGASGAATAIWNRTGATDEYKRSEWMETLIHKINDVSTEIFKLRFRHANFVVIGPDALNLLDRLNTFRALGGGTDGKLPAASISQGANVVGTLANRYTVVVDPLAPRDKILVGYKGEGWTETGYILAPYAAFRTETVTDPHTFKQVRAVMSRDGRHLVSADFYGEVAIQNL